MNAQTRIALGLATLAALVAAVAVLWWARPPALPATARPVHVVVQGIPPDAPFTALLRAGPTPLEEGVLDLGRRAAPSVVRLDWVLGAGCEVSCPDRCPAWCQLGSETVQIPLGEGLFTTEIRVTPAAPRAVRVHLDAPVDQVLLAGGPGIQDEDGVRFEPLPPGTYELLLESGDCPVTARGCTSAGDPCPMGCLSARHTVTVPVGEGEVRIALTLPRPAPADPTPTRIPGNAPVSGSAYADYLRTHPAWTREVAIAEGRADARYLKGWNPDPPPGPVTQVTWSAAEAYCADRGGLLGIDEAPRTWDRAGGLTQEWRSAGGQPAWRRFDGVKSTQPPDPNRAFSFTGFRCRR